jgi:hypothetical protein
MEMKEGRKEGQRKRRKEDTGEREGRKREKEAGDGG